jgi:hypothetical protein
MLAGWIKPYWKYDGNDKLERRTSDIDLDYCVHHELWIHYKKKSAIIDNFFFSRRFQKLSRIKLLLTLF